MEKLGWALLALSAVAMGMWAFLGSRAPGRPVPRLEPERPEATEAQIDAVRAPLAEKLDATRRAVARIALEPLGDDDPLVSKVGGAPYLPRGEPWPTTPEGEPLVHLAQINFAELPEMPGYPSDGIVQFFIGADEVYGLGIEAFEGGSDPEEALSRQAGFRVRHHPAPLRPPDELEARRERSDFAPHAPDEPRRMRFTRDEEPISALDARFEAKVGVDPTAFVEAASERLGVSARSLQDVFATGDGHKVGGYPFFTQTDPRAPESELELLLQLDSDEAMMWGDAGVGGFFIRPADLAHADFRRVLYSWDCH